MTILEQLVEAIRKAAIYNRHDQARPKVVLWPDGERVWEEVIPLVKATMPELLVLDSSAAQEQQGPSTWIRYWLTRGDPEDVPVIYLPGVTRQAFRGAAAFPPEARHLYALQFQGQFWTQANSKDWTPLAFLSSPEGGLGLDVARDNATLDGLVAQLSNVLKTPVSSLTGHKLEASDFHSLAAGDPVRLLLRWIGAPEATKNALTADKWQGFTAICRERYSFDPEKDGVLVAAERMAAADSAWDVVWDRYSESPTTYLGVRQALDLVQPKDLFSQHNVRLPGANRRAEEDLRRGLTALEGLPKAAALDDLERLTAEHRDRAQSVWARLGEASLACAAQHLGAMVQGIRGGAPGVDWGAFAESYAAKLWVVDASALKAQATVREAQDLKAVGTALRAVYFPWLEDLAVRLGPLLSSYPNSNPSSCRQFASSPGNILLFVDGLRCDIGQELRQRLEDKGLKAELTTSWAPLPTVTSTAKPAWRPLAERLAGDEISDAFEPQVREKKRPLKTAEFRTLLSAVGWPFVGASELGDPGGGGWTEAGSFDEYGHDQGWKLAWRIQEELDTVCARIDELLRGGWKKVTVITDHGWLLAPGGLPKVDLPGHLTVSKWGRCALAQAGAQHGYREVPWFWGGQHSVILAPGISVFTAGLEYAHGGLTLQEALIPSLLVTSGAAAAGRQVRIGSLKWAGLRLRIVLEGSSDDLAADLRTRPGDATSSVLSEDQRLKSPDPDGQVSLRVDRDELIGQAAVVVVVLGGQVICKQPVTIGED